MKRNFHSYDERRLTAVAKQAIEETQQAVESALTIRYGSPTQRLIAELGVYARRLATWTCDAEEIGEVRPLRDLLNDAALHIAVTSNLASAASAMSAGTAETAEQADD